MQAGADMAIDGLVPVSTPSSPSFVSFLEYLMRSCVKGPPKCSIQHFNFADFTIYSIGAFYYVPSRSGILPFTRFFCEVGSQPGHARSVES